MVKPEKPLKKKEQIEVDEKVARNLEAQLQAELEEEERLARQKEEEAKIALIAKWNDVQAMMDADHKLAERLQAGEQGELTIEERSRLFVELLKNKSFKEVQKAFDNTMSWINSFVSMDSEVVKDRAEGSETRAEGSSKRAGKELESDKSKKQKLDVNPLNLQSLLTRKIIKEGKISSYHIIRADGSSKRSIQVGSTSKSSVGDTSSESSARPFRKRHRSPSTTVTSSIHATRALVPFCVDLLPPCKRFRDSISPEDSVKEDIDTDVLEDIKADAMAIKFAVDRDVEAGVDIGINTEIDVGVNVEDEVEDEVESSDRGTIEVGVDVVAGIDILDGMLMPDVVERLEQRELEARSMIARRERASLLDQVVSLERSNARLRGTMMMERARADRFRQRVRFMESELRQIRRFCYYDRIRFRRLETFAAIEELVNRRVEEALAAYEVTRAANALEAENQSQNGSEDDNGNEGNRNGGNGNGENGNGDNENPNENNRDARPVTRECTYQDFMKCQPLNFKGMEGVVRFQELIMMCTKMVPDEEEDRVENIIGGLPDNIQGNMIAVEPMRLQDAVWIASNLMEQKLKGYALKNAENKRGLEVNQRDNRGQQPPFKGQNVGGQNMARAYTASNNERKPYNGPLPLYNKYSSSFPALLELPSALVSLPSALSFTTSESIDTNEFIQLMVLSKAF
nr:hypothetical protein [Tanacetum cinerariifolium]